MSFLKSVSKPLSISASHSSTSFRNPPKNGLQIPSSTLCNYHHHARGAFSTTIQHSTQCILDNQKPSPRSSSPFTPLFPFLTLTTASDCTPLTLPSPSCSYEFIISATNAQPDFTCRLRDYGSPVSSQNTTLSDPRWNSFGAYRCNGDDAHSGGWQISWGYNSDHDSAVVCRTFLLALVDLGFV